MDSCPECRAFLQPDWDRCKICGHVLGTPTTAEASAAAGKGRRAKKARVAAPAPPSPPARSRAPVTAASRPPSSQAVAGSPLLVESDAAPQRSHRPAGDASRTPWLIGAAVVVVAAIAAYLVLGGEDEPDLYADRAAAESAEGQEEAVDALGDWGTFPVGAISVELPAPPFVEEVEEQILVIGEMTMTRGEALSGGLTYTVASGPLPDGVAGRDPDELIGRVVDRWATAEAGSVVTSEEITVDGAPGVRANISGLERDTHLVVFIDDGWLVELRVAGQEPDPLAMQRLIDSYDR